MKTKYIKALIENELKDSPIETYYDNRGIKMVVSLEAKLKQMEHTIGVLNEDLKFTASSLRKLESQVANGITNKIDNLNNDVQN